MLVSSIMVCVGQLFWKIGTSDGLIYVLIGFVLYGIGALAMLIAYHYGKVSVLQPVLSMNYVISILLGTLLLNEMVIFTKYLGVCFIIIGVICIAGGDEE